MVTLEKQLVTIMVDENCSLIAALEKIFEMNSVDTNSVIDIVDFLEKELPDLDTVQFFMKMWTGDENDMVLKVDGNEESKKKD